MAGDGLLDVSGEGVPEMPSVHDPDRLRDNGCCGFGVGAGPVASRLRTRSARTERASRRRSGVRAKSATRAAVVIVKLSSNVPMPAARTAVRMFAAVDTKRLLTDWAGVAPLSDVRGVSAELMSDTFSACPGQVSWLLIRSGPDPDTRRTLPGDRSDRRDVRR